MKGGYIKFYNEQIKHSKKVLIEDLFGAYILNEEYEREIKGLFSKEVKENKGYTMNCFFYGCIHQINGDCPIINGGK